MSLIGLTIAITSSRRGSELARIVESFGGTPYSAPTVGIDADLKKPDETILEFMKRITELKIDYMIFMTGPGVFTLMSLAKSSGMEGNLLRALQNVNVIARSAKPQMVLKKFGIRTRLVPQENTTKGILELLKNVGILGKAIAILWHGKYQLQFREQLYKEGAAIVIEASTYQYSFELKNDGATILKSMGFNFLDPHVEAVTKLIEDIIEGKINVITFTSPPSVHCLFKIANINHSIVSLIESLNTNVIVAVVGPSTKEAIEEYGIRVDVMPEIYKMGTMIKSISDYVIRNNISGRTKVINQKL